VFRMDSGREKQRNEEKGGNMRRDGVGYITPYAGNNSGRER